MPPQSENDGERGCRLRTALYIFLLLLVSAIVFSNTLRNDYHLDSIYRVKQNTELERFWPPWRFFVDRRTGTTNSTIVTYRPLMPLSQAADASVARSLGLDRLVIHHAVNIAVHAVTALLLFALFREFLCRWSGLGLTPRRIADGAFAAALLFAVHPISGSGVDYIAGRDLLLMMMFFAACLLAYARMRSGGDTIRGWTAILVFYSLALLSKQNAIMTFAVVFAFETLLVRTRLSDWRLWGRVGAFLPGIAAILTMELASTGAFRMDNIASLPFGLSYPLTMASAHLFYYMKNFLWPFEMRALAQFDMADGVLATEVLIGGGFIVLSLLLALYWWKRSPLATFSILSYWILFAPTSSVLPMLYVVTDYRQYPSLAFLALFIVIVSFSLPRQEIVKVCFTALIGYFAISSYSLNTHWRTEESFWAQSVRYGGRELAHMNYAMSIQHKFPQLAEHHFRETLRIYPNHIYGNINLGLFYIRRGDREKGVALVEKAVRVNPRWALSHYWLGKAYGQLGRKREALSEILHAADLDPRHLRHQYEAGRTLQLSGQVAESMPYLERVQAINRYFRDTLFLIGWGHQKAGRTGQAITAYRSYVAHNPRHVQTHFNLGFALMTSGNCKEAVVHFNRVLALDGKRTAAHLHLARCYQALGDTMRAGEHRDKPTRSTRSPKSTKSPKPDGR